ncbi:hypothetical protein KFK09_023599 [Dendrobium nobile]|uniref:Uncharacterized protein n=1 Tax=Dendrobium nobile TaxID=94219 RepID=A0A8T3ABT2_DENNO|nr:hypothetical protein KFK09_023599 [Dendrobium nobile]
MLLLTTTPLLLIITDPARLRLKLAHLAEVKPHGACGEGIGFRGGAAVLVVCGAEAADKRVEASPGLAERARTRGGGVGLAEERTGDGVDFGLAELV